MAHITHEIFCTGLGSGLGGGSLDGHDRRQRRSDKFAVDSAKRAVADVSLAGRQGHAALGAEQRNFVEQLVGLRHKWRQHLHCRARQLDRPSVSYQSYSGSPDVEASSTWIGIGGQDGDETLIQIGTMQAAAPNGDAEYFAWYEILPDTEVPISRKQYPVKPGDTITATIQCTAACAPYGLSTWVLTLTNAGKWPQPYRITLQYASSLTSVEWIMEGPCIKDCGSSSPGFAYMPNYGSTTFSAISVNN
ncbi:MAG TPA: G1 family glutamic endopeptidase, partial [Xanthobacteraceae bacterium]|nr:G1 family glutamic endopeptidase [Xanthobacteraceae bacterium]